MNWVLVVAGAMVGAPLRYLTDRAVQTRHDTVFPWGTFAVNVTGCLILGVLTGAVSAGAAGSHLQLLVGTGLCGALTTYSTFSYETLRLTETGGGPLRCRQRRRQRDGGPRCGICRGVDRAGPVGVRGRADPVPRLDRPRRYCLQHTVANSQELDLMSVISVGQAAILGVVEGVTEFLPVSSTGHLKIVEGLMHIPVDDNAVVGFSAVIQVGAIAAVLVYFFKDIVRIVTAWGRGLRNREERYHHDYKFAWWVIYATIPIVLVGLAAKPLIDGPLGSLWVVAASLIVGSGVMWCADQMGRHKRGEDDTTFKDAMLVGSSQILALLFPASPVPAPPCRPVSSSTWTASPRPGSPSSSASPR